MFNKKKVLNTFICISQMHYINYRTTSIVTSNHISKRTFILTSNYISKRTSIVTSNHISDRTFE